MKIQYLEIVTTEVDVVCEQYSKLHNIIFGDNIPTLGGARIAELKNGGKVGIRSPLRDTEKPIIRPYFLVENIQHSVESAEKSGVEIAVPPMDLPGYGTCAIIIHEGIETGFWQLP